MGKRKNKNLLVRINDGDFDLLKVISKSNGLTVSETIRLLIDSTILDYKKSERAKARVRENADKQSICNDKL